MKIRILQNFRDYERGQVFDDWPGGMCDILIGRGLIEEVKEPVEVETAAIDEPVETADFVVKPIKKKAK